MSKAAKPKVVFFGSGPVAAESLERILAWCDVEAVITKPQPPHHKELFPVINLVQKYELPVHYVRNREELDELIESVSFDSNAAVLVDFGIIVSQAIIDSFELGIVNSHFSLLPEWRGADPITFSILSGQTKTGVSLMLLVQKMDEGPLLAFAEYDLAPDITTPQLTKDLIDISDELLHRTLPIYLDGDIVPQPQTVTGHEVSYSRKLSKADSTLDFSKPAAQLEREIRAFIEWPKSRTTLAGKEVIITNAHIVEVNTPETEGYKTIAIQTGDGLLVIDRLKPAGKPEMTAQAFLAGNKL